jgi:hypothetical protein
MNENEIALNARALVKAAASSGIAVFPCTTDKIPLIPAFNRLDTDISDEERAQIKAKWEDEHKGESPRFIGASKRPATVKAMLNTYKGSPFGVATGPTGVIVVDADKKHDGPAKIKALFDANGGVPKGAVIVPTQSGGVHYYFRNPDKMGCSAGALKIDYGCDVKGVGGFTVLPGTRISKEKSYGSKEVLLDLCATLMGVGTELPPLPDFLKEFISARGTNSVTSDADVAPLIEQLESEDTLDYATVFDPDVGYDLEAVEELSPTFRDALLTPGDDISSNRMIAANALKANLKGLNVRELACFYAEHPDLCGIWTEGKAEQGEWNMRSAARDFKRANDYSNKESSTGEAFGAVLDEEGDEPYVAKTKPVPSLLFKTGSEIVVGFKPSRWLVENTIPEVGVGMMYGPPNSGKTFVAVDISARITAEKEVNGRRVDAADVLYFYGEGADGLAGRVKALEQEGWEGAARVRFCTDMPELIVNRNGIMSKGPGYKQIIATAEAVIAQSDRRLGMIVLDTLSVMMPSASDSDDVAIKMVLKFLREIALRFKCAVMVLHHPGKDATRGARGSSVLGGDIDFSLVVAKPDKGPRELTSDKMRNGSTGKIATFALPTRVVGVDQWGGEALSCVVEYLGSAAALSATDDGDASETTDELSKEQRAEKLSARDKLGAEIAAYVALTGSAANGGHEAYLNEVVDAAPMAKLAKICGDDKSNRLRNFRAEFLPGGKKVDRDEYGSFMLILVKNSGAKGSILRAEPLD